MIEVLTMEIKKEPCKTKQQLLSERIAADVASFDGEIQSLKSSDMQKDYFTPCSGRKGRFKLVANKKQKAMRV